jgi:hypothetical protein
MIPVAMAARTSPIPVNTKFDTFTPCWKKSVERRSGSPSTAATVSLPRAESLVRAGVPVTSIGVFMVVVLLVEQRNDALNSCSELHEHLCLLVYWGTVCSSLRKTLRTARLQ